MIVVPQCSPPHHDLFSSRHTLSSRARLTPSLASSPSFPLPSSSSMYPTSPSHAMDHYSTSPMSGPTYMLQQPQQQQQYTVLLPSVPAIPRHLSYPSSVSTSYGASHAVMSGGYSPPAQPVPSPSPPQAAIYPQPAGCQSGYWASHPGSAGPGGGNGHVVYEVSAAGGGFVQQQQQQAAPMYVYSAPVMHSPQHAVPQYAQVQPQQQQHAHVQHSPHYYSPQPQQQQQLHPHQHYAPGPCTHSPAPLSVFSPPAPGTLPVSAGLLPPQHVRMQSAPPLFYGAIAPPTPGTFYYPAAAAEYAAQPSPLWLTPASPTSSNGSQAPHSPSGMDGAAVPAMCLASEYHSVIECGGVDPASGQWRLSHYAEYFGKEVEFFTALSDPSRAILYRVSTLAARIHCATNKVGMYLARRKSTGGGIYQATSFLHKPSGRVGLKAGGYFLSLAACREFEAHFAPGGLDDLKATDSSSEASGQSGADVETTSAETVASTD